MLRRVRRRVQNSFFCGLKGKGIVVIESHGKGEGSAENRRELWLRNSAMESRGNRGR